MKKVNRQMVCVVNINDFDCIDSLNILLAQGWRVRSVTSGSGFIFTFIIEDILGDEARHSTTPVVAT